MVKRAFIVLLVLSYPQFLLAQGTTEGKIESSAQPQTRRPMFLLAPYLGQLSNTYTNSSRKMDMKDSGTMYGFFAQVLQPSNYVATAFLYHVPQVNESKVTGLHLAADKFWDTTPSGSYVTGLGYENVDVKMNAGSKVRGLTRFDFSNNVNYYFARAGRNFTFATPSVRISVLPFAGYAYEDIHGDTTLVPFIPLGARGAGGAPIVAPTIKSAHNNYDSYWIAGVNTSTVLFHFVDLQLKYLAGFKVDRTTDASAMLNFYVSQNLGLSYRVKYSERKMDKNSEGRDIYQLGGLAYVF